VTTRNAAEPPAAVRELGRQVEEDGGQALATYREPIGGHWQIFCLLPREKVEPTPYQRDLSPTHAKKLQDVIKKIDRFVDPIVVVSPRPGLYWTPNGHHRLKALEKLKADWAPAVLIPDADVAFQILALNTEKAHNLKEKSLEVIRMYRGLTEDAPKKGEEDFTFQFEAPHFVTLGIVYEENRRFAGGAFAPILKRVDKFLSGNFTNTLPVREERAAQVKAADAAVAAVVAALKKKGINHPYVKNYVLARTTPLSRQRKTVIANVEAFDIGAVKYDEIRRAANFASAAAED
jgi:ParB family chromosome partitioning protein